VPYPGWAKIEQGLVSMTARHKMTLGGEGILASTFAERIAELIRRSSSGTGPVTGDRGQLAGTVMGLSGDEAAPLDFAVVVADGGMPSRCDERGSFAITDLAVGCHRLVFDAHGYQRQSSVLHVWPGRSDTIRVTLHRP
jgi:hypothetical protein